MAAEIDVEINNQWRNDLAELESQLDEIDGRDLDVGLNLDDQAEFRSQVETLTSGETLEVEVEQQGGVHIPTRRTTRVDVVAEDDNFDVDSFIPEEKTVTVNLRRGDGWEDVTEDLQSLMADLGDDAVVDIDVADEETTDQLQSLREASELIDEINEKEIQITVPEGDVTAVQERVGSMNESQGNVNVPDGGMTRVDVQGGGFERIQTRLATAGDIEFEDARENLSQLLDQLQTTEGAIAGIERQADSVDAELFVRSEVFNQLQERDRFDGRFNQPTLRFDAALDNDSFQRQLNRRIRASDIPEIPRPQTLDEPLHLSPDGSGSLYGLSDQLDTLDLERDLVIDVDVEDLSSVSRLRATLRDLDNEDVDIEFDVEGSRFSLDEMSEITAGEYSWHGLSPEERGQIFRSEGFGNGFDLSGMDDPMAGLGRIFSGNSRDYFINENIGKGLEELGLIDKFTNNRPESVQDEFGYPEFARNIVNELGYLERNEDQQTLFGDVGRFNPEYQYFDPGELDTENLDIEEGPTIARIDPDRRQMQFSVMNDEGVERTTQTFNELDAGSRQIVEDLRDQRRKDADGRQRFRLSLENFADSLIDTAESLSDRLDSKYRDISGGNLRAPGYDTDFQSLDAVDIIPSFQRDEDGSITGLNIPDINAEKIDDITEKLDNLGTKLRRTIIPTMSTWYNLIAGLVPALIAVGVNALGVAAAFGAIGGAAATVLGLGLIGHGNTLAESMKNAKAQIKSLKQNLYSVFQPAAHLFAPIQERFFQALPQYVQPVAMEIKGFTQFEDILHSGARGFFQWLAEGISIINEYGPALERLATRFGKAFGNVTLQGLRWLFNQAIANQDMLMRLGHIFIKIGGILYNFSMIVARVLVTLGPLFDIILAIAKAFNSKFGSALLSMIVLGWGLYKVLMAIGGAMAFIFGFASTRAALVYLFTTLMTYASSLLGILAANATMMSIITGGLAVAAGVAAMGLAWEMVGDAPVVPNSWDGGMGPADSGEPIATPPGVPAPSGGGKGAPAPPGPGSGPGGPGSSSSYGATHSATQKIVYNHYGDVRSQSDIDKIANNFGRLTREKATEEFNRTVDDKHKTDSTIPQSPGV
jgi:hypothetical protein